MADLEAMVTVAVDSDATVVAAAEAGIRHCVVDVNVGLPRCGVAPDRAGRLADAARGERSRRARRDGLRGAPHDGVATATNRAAQVAASMELLLRAHADVGGELVSAGGTGTFDLHGDTGVTEVQAGSYVLMDTAYGARNRSASSRRCS